MDIVFLVMASLEGNPSSDALGRPEEDRRKYPCDKVQLLTASDPSIRINPD